MLVPRQTCIDHELVIGDQVRRRITGPCARCVMTTLAQGDLPRDPGVLDTAVHRAGRSCGRQRYRHSSRDATRPELA